MLLNEETPETLLTPRVSWLVSTQENLNSNLQSPNSEFHLPSNINPFVESQEDDGSWCHPNSSHWGWSSLPWTHMTLISFCWSSSSSLIYKWQMNTSVLLFCSSTLRTRTTKLLTYTTRTYDSGLRGSKWLLAETSYTEKNRLILIFLVVRRKSLKCTCREFLHIPKKAWNKEHSLKPGNPLVDPSSMTRELPRDLRTTRLACVCLISLSETFVRKAMIHTKYITLTQQRKHLTSTEAFSTVSTLGLHWRRPPYRTELDTANSRCEISLEDQCGRQIKVPCKERIWADSSEAVWVKWRNV